MKVFHKTTIILFALCLVVQMPLCRAQSTGGTFKCGRSIVSDVDGNIYYTVQIGNQCWMRENLRTTRYSDCTEIPLGASVNYSVAYRYYPNGDEGNVPVYGYLYNWAAVMYGAEASSANPSGVQGICPAGWHVPSDAEWTQLTDYVSSQSRFLCGGESENNAKALADSMGWSRSSNTCAPGNNLSDNNATGFSAVPAGFYNGSYYFFGNNASFWSSTLDDIFVFYHDIYHFEAGVTRDSHWKSRGRSVRCLKN